MPCQLIDNVLVLIPPKPGKPREVDEYRCNSSCCVFIAVNPHVGTKMIWVNEYRTKADYADFMKENAANILMKRPLNCSGKPEYSFSQFAL